MRNSSIVLVMAMGFYAILCLSQLPVEWTGFLGYLSTRVTRYLTGGPAPLECYGDDEHKVKDTYYVTLNGGHSLEKHKSRIGRAEDLERDMSGNLHYHYDPVFGNQTDYKLVTKDMSLVAAVRTDYDVLIVMCSWYLNIRPLETATKVIDDDVQLSEPRTERWSDE